ncbi:Protein of unknown function [Lactobacillus delbrueckii subsp. lactis]|nr:Putative uncharacterized protein [Lactobacillus delbrueckii subsp. lactis]CDR81328.1 Protein of unknown function [Lactobacillus delbrueckii subsp. lactis]CDR82040.1 Protein of unknown function [Lactobacillus delbrueckii subsp. lactis]CDR84016.1 Protein of unknown function [Lactobacillus delbrueckii subsp. lactis]
MVEKHGGKRPNLLY